MGVDVLMASNVSSDNPLGLEPSELAASKRAKAAAAAAAAKKPLSLADQIRATISPVTDAERAAVAGVKDANASAITDAKAAVADAAANAASTAAQVGGTVNAAGMVVPKDPLRDKTVAPQAPAGQHYTWIGGTTTGSWQLYKDAPIAGSGGGATGGNVTTSGTTGDNSTVTALQKQIADLTSQVNSTTAANQAALNASRQNAITFLTATFNDMGLGADIANAVTNLVQQGYTADTIQMIAQDPNSKDPLAVAFKQRFPANAARMQAGLPVLSPAEYLATERSYAQVLQSYGLPSGFAQNKDVFTKLLTSDVSPTELNSRVSTAKQVIDNSDPLVTQQLQQYYGLSQGDMIAHVLDPSIATPIIQKQITASQIGAESARAGVNVNQTYAEQLGGLGISQAQANTGFQNIAQSQQGMQELAARYDAYGPAGQVGQQLQAATFGTTGAAAATAELNRLKMQEVSQFSGSSGAGKGSLMGTEAGLS